MNLNLIKLIVKPREIIKSAFDKPSTVISIILVLLPATIFFALNSFFNLELNVINPAFFSIIAWIVLALLIYAVGFIVKGSDKVKGKFSGLTSALSYVWFFLFISGIIIFYAMTLIAPLITTTVIAKESLEPNGAVELISIMTLTNKEALIDFENAHNLSASQKVRLEKIFDEGKLRALYNQSGNSPAGIELFIFALTWSLLPFIYGFIILPFIVISEYMKSNRLMHLIVWFGFFFAVTSPAFLLAGLF